jgi:transposase
MIDWKPVLDRLGYASELAMWQDLYEQKGLSISELADRFNVGRTTIRDALWRRGIAVRSRGGANHHDKIVPNPELLEAVRKEGIRAVAIRMGLSKTAVYKRIRATLKG